MNTVCTELRYAIEMLVAWDSRGGQENGGVDGIGAGETEPAAHYPEDVGIVK